MLEIKEYVKAESLEQAFELNQKRTNQIIGGMLWMKMGDHRIQTAIDLSGLGLDTIEEDETQFSIGCMTSLRQLELHEGLNQWSDGAVRESVSKSGHCGRKYFRKIWFFGCTDLLPGNGYLCGTASQWNSVSGRFCESSKR